MENNNLTRFNVGGRHEENSNGGILQGQSPDGRMNTVEQGETKNGNYVYSDRLSINENLTKASNLPGYIKGKTFASASKVIENKFKDRVDRASIETKKELLNRLQQAQETVRQQDQDRVAQINQSMQANAQAPSGLPNQAPPGMEEYSEQPQQEQSQQQAQMNPASPIAAFGGYQVKRYDNGGYIQGDANLDGIVDSRDTLSGTAKPNTTGIVGSSIGAVGTLMDLGNTAFGKAAQDTSGQAASNKANAFGMVGGSALQGAASGAQIGNMIVPGLGGIVGGGAGALLGAGAGALGLGKERKAEALNTRNFAANMNRSMSDHYAAYGGYLRQLAQGGGLTGADRGSDEKPYPMVASGDFAGGGRSYPIPTRADAVDALRLAGLHGRSDVRAKVFEKYPDLKHTMGGYITSKPSHYEEGGYMGINELAKGGTIHIDPKNRGKFTATKERTGKSTEELTHSKNPLTRKRAIFAQNARKWHHADGGEMQYADSGPINKYDATPDILSGNYGVSPNTNYYGVPPILRGDIQPGVNPKPAPTNYSGIPNVLSGNMPAYSGTDVAHNVTPPTTPTITDKVKKGLGVAGKAIGENFGEALRYAPIAMNAYQLATLPKTKGVSYAQSDARFKPNYVDEAQLQRIVDQEANNQIRGLQESGASEGAIRAATLGAGLNKTKALSDAYMNAAAQNRTTDVQGQQFNYAVQQANLERQNKAIDEMRMDTAARASAKSKLLATMGTDIGSIGKEQADAKLAKALTGYTRSGQYILKPSGEKASAEETAAYNKLYPLTNTLNTSTTINAMGGYLNTSKRRK